MTQAAYAAQRGVTPARINHLISKGVIVLVNGKVDPDQADTAIEAAANPAYSKTPGRPAKDRGPSNYANAAAREKHFKALLAELDLKEREGELVNARKYNDLHILMIVAAKTRLRSIPTTVAGEVAHLGKTLKGRAAMAAISKLLLTAIDSALLELSQWKPERRYDGDEKTNGGSENS